MENKQHTFSIIRQTVFRALDMCLSLLVPFLMLAAAGVWSGEFLGNAVGSEPGQTTTVKVAVPTPEELAAMGLAGAVLQPRDSVSWNVTATAEGKPAGRIVSSQLSAHEVMGYAGPVPVFMHIDPSHRVQAILPAENAETPSFLAEVMEKLIPQWQGKTVDEAMACQVDAVSGATYSSKAFQANVRAALRADQSAAGEMGKAEPAIGWGKTCAVLAVLLAGGIVAWRFRGKSWLRLMLLAANVLVCGFWCGQFLSLSLLLGWVEHGSSWVYHLPVVALLAFSLLMSILGKRGHYCNWVCPYGSLQELAWRLPVPKIPVSSQAWKVLRWVRRMIFGLLMWVLWTGYGAFLLDYEPFSAFGVTTAATAVLVLAAAFGVLSLFVPRPWCKCCCPLGEWLDLIR